MKKISLDSIINQIKEKLTKDYDIVIAIGRGGILPGYLISRFVDIPMKIVYVDFRNDKHEQKYENPKVKINADIKKIKDKKILIVDDISNSGKTIKSVKKQIPNNEITTVVIYGNADISLFGKHDECIEWPWQ
ncbi:MAG: phosphoribosyltransferase [Candidatus Marinimicrobia bacterium]|nr:phosphoribosyltransferase [Candidatus Neomarinimicrobiota bacterium]